jgi:5-formyltetrahydrofolate cyclo-ligase
MSRDKDELRKYIWDLLEVDGLSVKGKSPYGRIPDFKGSARAAELLSHTVEWEKSRTIFCSPDTAQRMVRELALKDKKNLIIPSPKLEKGYIFIKGTDVKGNEEIASTIKGAFKYGNKIGKFPMVDLVVEGSVAVDKNGNRLGKGGGYGDREISELFHHQVIDGTTPIIALVHEVQIVNIVPTETHDKKINMIVTPKEVMRLFNEFNGCVVH